MHIRFEITQFIDVNSVKLGDVFLAENVCWFCRTKATYIFVAKNYITGREHFDTCGVVISFS